MSLFMPFRDDDTRDYFKVTTNMRKLKNQEFVDSGGGATSIMKMLHSLV